jgi:DNA repair exonuclease SbcCD ATPase subunit
MWHLETVELNGGFLPGLKLSLPRGLTCIIGPRGSGKSTLAEAIRFALCGTASLSKSRLELIQANLGEGSQITVTTNSPAGSQYAIKRSYKQPAVLLTPEGRSISIVDLDRGTFLPIDAYNSSEIESIADEQLGARRRGLLDDLRGDELQKINLSLGEHSRGLAANADQIRAAIRTIADLTEQIEEIGDVRAKLNALGPTSKKEASEEFVHAARQQQINPRETRGLESAKTALDLIRGELESNHAKLVDYGLVESDENQSANASILRRTETQVQRLLREAAEHVKVALGKLDETEPLFAQAQQQLTVSHRDQAAKFATLNESNQAASEKIRQRAALEQQVARLQDVEKNRASVRTTLEKLRTERKSLKAAYLSERERISDLREAVAKELQAEAGGSVRVRVLRHSDDLAYKQSLMDGLRGARVRNHDDMRGFRARLNWSNMRTVFTGSS